MPATDASHSVNAWRAPGLSGEARAHGAAGACDGGEGRSGGRRIGAFDAEPTAPAVRILDRYLTLAAEAGASDLHLEPAAGGLWVRMRVDGQLRPLEPPPGALVPALLTRARLLAGVDLAERRLPADGSFRVDVAASLVDRQTSVYAPNGATKAGHREQALETQEPCRCTARSAPAVERIRRDVRASFVPVRGGEKIVLRILEHGARRMDMRELGMAAGERAMVERAIRRSNGMIVVVGPTGSGKTTTLYTALSVIADPTRAVVSVEDPVELDLDGVTQIEVDDDIGRSFAVLLRAVLRQDPDVIMVGEMRDTDSARIACRAALTGHLVLTTLHTADTREALLRLRDMGVPERLVDATVALVVAQRLLRRLCRECAVRRAPAPHEHALYVDAGLEPPQVLWGARGCDACHNQGYRGRVAVFELLECGAGDGVVRLPTRNLFAAALDRAASGQTDVAEALARCPSPVGTQG